MAKKKDFKAPKIGSGKFTEVVPVGNFPPGTNPKMAWWYLSRRAKEKLSEMRKIGYFGGVPGTAPYWYVLEKGNAEVGVEPMHFLEKSMTAFDSSLPAKVDSFFGGKK